MQSCFDVILGIWFLKERPDPNLCHYSLCDSRRLCCQRQGFRALIWLQCLLKSDQLISSIVTLQSWEWFSMIVGSFSFETLDIVCRKTFVLKLTSYNRKSSLRKNQTRGLIYMTGVNIGANGKGSSSAAIWTHWCVNNSLFGIRKISQKFRENF